MTVPVHGLPLVLDEGMTVVAVPPALKGPRSHRVTSCSDGPTGQLVALSGVLGLSDASALVGKTLLVREADLPEGFALHDVASLLGREVVDREGVALGRIEEVMQGPANDVWVVVGKGGEVLLPVIPQVVDEVPAGGPIPVVVPGGLLDEEGSR